MELKNNPEAFKKFAVKAKKDIEQYKEDVRAELYAMGDKFPDAVCNVSGGIFSCWEGNKNYFTLKNEIKDMYVGDYQSRAFKATREKQLKNMGEPVVAVKIAEGDGFVRFLIECPYWKTSMCKLRNFNYNPKKNKL